jgi:hypothetical protein
MHNPWVSPFSYLAISSPPPLTAAVMVHTTELLFRSHLSPLLLLAHLPYALFAHLLSHSLILIHLPPSLCQLPSAPNFDCFDASQGPGVCSFGIAVFMPCYSNDFEGFQPSLSYVYRAPQSGSLPGISTERKSVLDDIYNTCGKAASPQIRGGQLQKDVGRMPSSRLRCLAASEGFARLPSGRHGRWRERFTLRGARVVILDVNQGGIGIVTGYGSCSAWGHLQLSTGTPLPRLST